MGLSDCQGCGKRFDNIKECCDDCNVQPFKFEIERLKKEIVELKEEIALLKYPNDPYVRSYLYEQEHTEQVKMSSYVKLDDCVWPNPKDENGIQWKLRYGQPTKEDLLVAASFLSAYKALFFMSQKDAMIKINKIKRSISNHLHPEDSPNL